RKGRGSMMLTLRDLTAVEVPKPLVEWEEPDCLLCGGHRWAPLLEAPDCTRDGTGLWFAVVQCHDCGLCFTNPRPSAASMAQFYPPSYPPHRTAASRRPPKPWHIRFPSPWRGPRKERRFLEWHGRGRLLDFGCGGGSFLERMHAKGWQVTGLDISPA